ncbi:MAG: hypothetical protein HYV63_11865 [Candidatus Schekmanbacteria bacterium]|nr:hypothetical protein [Candidatus Schekmanbacteria bacterium]
MELTKQEKDFQKLMQIWAILFLVSGIVFFGLHNVILELLDTIGGWFGMHQHLAPSVSEGTATAKASHFWMVLVLSLMATLSVLCYSIYRNPKRNHVFIVPVLISKALSTLGFLAALLIGRIAFGYLLGFLVDGTILVLTLVYYGRTDLDEELLAMVKQEFPEPIIPLWGDEAAAKQDPAPRV